MEGNFWKTWLLVGALLVFGGSSRPQNEPLTYEKAVDLAVAIYNSKAGEVCVYRLLEAFAEPYWDPISESHQELNFTIKETMCLLEDMVFFDECDFKEDGVVRQCTGYYYFDERPPVVVLSCVVVGIIEEEKGEEVEKKEEEMQQEENQAKNKEEVEKKEVEKQEKDQPKRVKRFLRAFEKLKKAFKKLFKKKKVVTGHVTP